MTKSKKTVLPYGDYTYEELADKIDSEGFDYFFTEWVSIGEFHDPDLRALVERYREAAKALEGFLRERGGLL